VANEKTNSENTFGRAAVAVTLLSGATGTTTGAWAHVAGMHPLSIYVGCTNATVVLYQALGATAPSSALGDTLVQVSGGRFMELASGAQQYIMAKVTAHTSGVVTAYAFGYGAG
jgi:hypothetical protein